MKNKYKSPWGYKVVDFANIKIVTHKPSNRVYSNMLMEYERTGCISCEEPTSLIWEIGRDFARVRPPKYSAHRVLLGSKVKFVPGYGVILRFKKRDE